MGFKRIGGFVFVGGVIGALNRVWSIKIPEIILFPPLTFGGGSGFRPFTWEPLFMCLFLGEGNGLGFGMGLGLWVGEEELVLLKRSLILLTEPGIGFSSRDSCESSN